MQKKITKWDARKVLKVVDAGLVSGLGQPVPGEMCVMAAINYALGGEHGDEPDCVHPIIRSFDIALNDAQWSSNEARAAGMRREAIAKLGSSGIDDRAWLDYVVEQHIRRVVPIQLKVVANLIPAHAKALNSAAQLCEANGDQSAAWSAESATKMAAWSAESATKMAAWSAAKSAVESAESAAKSAGKNTHSPDEILTLSAEIATEACIKFGTQGSRWLDIVK